MSVALQEYMSASTAIAPVRAAFRGELIAVKMRRTCPATAGPAAHLYVVNEI